MNTKLRDSKLKEGLEDCTGGRVQAAHIFEKLTEDEILDERRGSVWRPPVSQASPAFRRAATKSNLDSTVLRITRHTPQCRAGSCAATVLYWCSTRCRLFHCLIYLLGARSHTINRSPDATWCQVMNVATCSIHFSPSFIAELKRASA